MDHGEPILWVKNKRDSHRVVSDLHGTRFESASGSAGRVIAGVILLLLASLPISLSIYLLSGAEETYASEVLDECWEGQVEIQICLLYTSPSPRDQRGSRMPSSA